MMMKNYWIIGDIHGEVRLLDRLLDHVLPKEPEALVFLGDYIDRGPASREVVDRIRELKTPVHCLMGNHEMMMLNALDDMGYGHGPVELWYYNGGEATLQSFGASSFFSLQSDLDPVYLDFFRNLKMNHVIHFDGQRKILCTHAGVSPAIPLTEQLSIRDHRELSQYILDRHIDPGDSFLWVREAFFQQDPVRWDGYLVVHGHTPVAKLKRFVQAGDERNFSFLDNDLCLRRAATNREVVSLDIDSGSAISGRLTGLGLYEKETTGNGPAVAMQSLTVSLEEIFPRDLGFLGV